MAGAVDPSKVYYINADDGFHGLISKLALAEQAGFHMLAPGFKGFSESMLATILRDILNKDQAHDTVIILDTFKKFTSIMEKTSVSEFNKLLRQFVLKGGTVVALAHTNKNRDAHGKPVYAGTTDVLEDADCAYILDVIDDDDESRTVAFENIKRRGNVAERAAYRYSRAPGKIYPQVLASVEEVDATELERVKQANVERRDQRVIDGVLGALAAGTNKKMELLKGVAVKAGVSQRTVMQVLDRYTGDDPVRHRWTYDVGERGAKLYRPLAPAQSDAT